MLSLSITSPGTAATFLRGASSATSTSSSFHGVRIRHEVSARVPAATVSSSSGKTMVVMMSKREAELKDIRGKTTEELNEEVIDLKGELFMLRLQKSARNEFKSSDFRRMKKQVRASFFFVKIFIFFIYTNLEAFLFSLCKFSSKKKKIIRDQ